MGRKVTLLSVNSFLLVHLEWFSLPFSPFLILSNLHHILIKKVKVTQSCPSICHPMAYIERKMKISQSCPTFCYSMDYRVRAILQARILEWADFPFSRGSSQPRDRTQASHIVGRFFTSWAKELLLLNCGVGEDSWESIGLQGD